MNDDAMEPMEDTEAASIPGYNNNNNSNIHHRVELANLLLPVPVYDNNNENETEDVAPSGVATHTHGGGGGVVLLEAKFETCSELMNSTCQAQIQAVVDLEKLSELVGLPCEQFLTDWHHQVNEELQLNHTTKKQQQQQQQEDLEIENLLFVDAEQDFSKANSVAANEQTKLLGSAVPQPPVLLSTGVEDPMHQQMEHHHHAVADRIAFGADAFLETLTDVVATSDHAATAAADDDSNTDNNHYFDRPETAAATATITPSGPYYPHQSLCHNSSHHPFHSATHAFLLEKLPPTAADSSTGGGGGEEEDAQHHCYILALPTDASPWDYDDDDDDISEAASDTSFLHGVTFLPSDVQDVQLEATSIPLPKMESFHENNVGEDDDMNWCTVDSTTGTSRLYRKQLSLQQQQQQQGHSYTPIGIRLDMVVKRQVPFIGYVILITGLWALSSVGVALNWQGHDVSPLLKTYWRLSSTSLVLLPMAIQSARISSRSSTSSSEQQQSFSWPNKVQWMLLVVCSACYAFMTAAFVIALDLTSVVNAFVLSDLAPLFLIVGRWAVGYPVLYTEGWGAAIGFLGGTICALDPSSSSSDSNTEVNAAGGGFVVVVGMTDSSSSRHHPHAFTGDVLAILASAAMAIYLLIAKRLRPHIDLFLFMFLIMWISSIFMLGYMILAGEDIRLSSHPNFGLWGWTNLSADRLPLEMYLAIVCNVLGTTGYVAVMKYFEPVVVSTVMLMEPVLGALMGVAAGLDPLPGLQTWVGNAVVTVGIVLVVWSGARTTKTIDATEALCHIGGGGGGGETGGGGTTVALMKSPIVTKPMLTGRSQFSPLLKKTTSE